MFTCYTGQLDTDTDTRTRPRPRPFRTSSLVAAAHSASSSSQSSLQLFTLITELLSPLVNSDPTSTSTSTSASSLAAYFQSILWPALEPVEGAQVQVQHAQVITLVQDTLLDVVWQADQQIDAGALLLVPPPSTSNTAPDTPDAPTPTTTTTTTTPTPTPTLTPLERQTQARTNLAQFVALLLVSVVVSSRLVVLIRLPHHSRTLTQQQNRNPNTCPPIPSPPGWKLPCSVSSTFRVKLQVKG